MLFECKDCQVKSTVPGFIQSGYAAAAAAAKYGVAIDQKTQMTLTVKEYAERSLAMRSVSLGAGPLASMVKDEIKSVATIYDREVEVEYFYRVLFSRIESVAEKIGEMSFEKAVDLLFRACILTAQQHADCIMPQSFPSWLWYY